MNNLFEIFAKKEKKNHPDTHSGVPPPGSRALVMFHNQRGDRGDHRGVMLGQHAGDLALVAFDFVSFAEKYYFGDISRSVSISEDGMLVSLLFYCSDLGWLAGCNFP